MFKSALSEPLDFTRDKLRESKGFTLVELLVVITIIAILATIGLAIYSSVQKGVRDAKRKADLIAISRALEQYKAVKGKYPQMLAWSDVAASWGQLVSALSPSYMAQVPVDPINEGTRNSIYWYVYGYMSRDGISFKICANLENNSDPARNMDYPNSTPETPVQSCSEDGQKWGDYKVVSQQ